MLIGCSLARLLWLAVCVWLRIGCVDAGCLLSAWPSHSVLFASNMHLCAFRGVFYQGYRCLSELFFYVLRQNYVFFFFSIRFFSLFAFVLRFFFLFLRLFLGLCVFETDLYLFDEWLWIMIIHDRGGSKGCRIPHINLYVWEGGGGGGGLEFMEVRFRTRNPTGFCCAGLTLCFSVFVEPSLQELECRTCGFDSSKIWN